VDSPLSKRLLELAVLFLRQGTTAVGGPAAHNAMFEDEVVRRRKWLTHEEFLDLLGATNLIPGPNSTEMAIHVGHRRAGGWGLLVAGASFIIPAAGITLAFAWAYQRFGTLPEAEAVLYGVKPVIIAVVAQALWALGRTALKTWTLGIVAAASVAASLLGVAELVVLLAAGVVVVLVAGGSRSRAAALLPPLPFDTGATLAAAGVTTAAGFSLGKLFLVFAKIGAVLYGSGYVLLAFLRSDLVERLGWLTEQQLLDAVAVGQVTPGPVFTTATFIGYLVGGWQGAVVATVGIFLPAFVFVALSGLVIPRIRRSKMAGAFLDGVIAASLALMAVVTGQLAFAALVDVPTVLFALASGVLLLRFKLNSSWLILGGAVVGSVVRAVG